MPAPIRVPWVNRPGWSEFGAFRVHGSHQGYDSYCAPKAAIHGTSARGRVTGKGYDAAGWGHWVDVTYPGYRERSAHMVDASDLTVGAAVGVSTVVGRVGRTGNAAPILWVRNGVELWHVHSQCWVAGKTVNPLTLWGATTAGGGTGPFDPPPVKKIKRIGKDMLILGRLANMTVAAIAEGGGTRWYSSAAEYDLHLKLAAVYNGIAPEADRITQPQPLNKSTVLFVDDLAFALMEAIYTSQPNSLGVTFEGVTKAQFDAAVAGINANIDDQPTTFTITPS